MPVAYAPDEVGLADKSPCAAIRADLKMCLLESPCCRKEKKTPRECLKRFDETVPDECKQLRTTFFECKRSLKNYFKCNQIKKQIRLLKWQLFFARSTSVSEYNSESVQVRGQYFSWTIEEDSEDTKVTYKRQVNNPDLYERDYMLFSTYYIL